MHPEYGKSVHTHQKGSFEPHFWLPLLQLHHVLVRLLVNHMIKTHPDKIMFLDLTESTMVATMLVQEIKKELA